MNLNILHRLFKLLMKNAAIFVNSGVWLTADSLKADKNQFLHLDLIRLMRVSKVCDIK